MVIVDTGAVVIPDAEEAVSDSAGTMKHIVWLVLGWLGISMSAALSHRFCPAMSSPMLR